MTNQDLSGADAASRGRKSQRVWALVSAVYSLVAPFACFTLLKHHGMSDVRALTWTSLLPLGKMIVDAVRRRPFDLLGGVVLWEILLTVWIGKAFHDPRLILLKGPIQVAAVAIACLVSLALRMPLAGVLTQILGRSAVRVGGADAGLLRDAHPGRLRVVTIVWAVVSIVDAVVRTAMIYSISTGKYILLSRAIQTVYFWFLGLWTFAYLRPAPKSDTTSA